MQKIYLFKIHTLHEAFLYNIFTIKFILTDIGSQFHKLSKLSKFNIINHIIFILFFIYIINIIGEMIDKEYVVNDKLTPFLKI